MEKEDISIIDIKKNDVQNKIKEYENLSNNEKYSKFNEELENLIIDIQNEDIDIILDYTSSLFFKICLYIKEWQIKDILNLLSKLYHKLKNLYFFNIMVSLYKKIENITHDIDSKYYTNFNIYKDLILQSVYDYEKNQKSEYKTLGINLKSKTIDKFQFLTEKLEEIFSRENIFLSYDLLIGDFEEGYTLRIKFNDKYLIVNDFSVIKEMKELLQKYGIVNNNWFEYEGLERRNIRRPKNTLTEDENNKMNEDIEEKIKKEKKIIESLKKLEKYIKIKFKNTKRNTKLYKEIFFKIKNLILSNELVKNKIREILPYGSVTQCTNTEESDLEMTIITNNYETASKEYISQIMKDIEEKIENKNEEFEIYLEGIRETKRTILLLLRHKETKTEIEINCNNFFSVMNSTLIRNYLVYDARALILVNTIKDWSKIKEINSNNKGFLSSYCYTLMTIYFLQRIKDPLLPIFSSYNDLINLKVSEKEFFIERQLLQSSELMKNWHTRNKEDTVTTLLLKWMIFYLYIFNGEEYCIDISNKRLTYRFNDAKYLSSFVSGTNKLSAYCFIDMFDYTYNPGSYMEINSSEHHKFKDVLKESIGQLLEGKEDFFKASNIQ